MDCLKVENLSVEFSDGTKALKNLSFSVEKGEILSIVGESGSGKTTLLNAIDGFLDKSAKITSGTIEIDNQIINGYTKKDFRKIRGTKIGVVFQEPGSTLNPVRKIGSQFIETLQFHKKLNREEAYDFSLEMLEKVGLSAIKIVMEKYPFELSIGMKQRVAIAIAISLSPNLILLDEPTSSLDATTQKKIIDGFIKLNKKYGITIVNITHNLALARHLSDRILVLYRGEKMEYGMSQQVINFPTSDYTKKLISDIPKLKGSKNE